MAEGIRGGLTCVGVECPVAVRACVAGEPKCEIHRMGVRPASSNPDDEIVLYYWDSPDGKKDATVSCRGSNNVCPWSLVPCATPSCADAAVVVGAAGGATPISSLGWGGYGAGMGPGGAGGPQPAGGWGGVGAGGPPPAGDWGGAGAAGARGPPPGWGGWGAGGGAHSFTGSSTSPDAIFATPVGYFGGQGDASPHIFACRGSGCPQAVNLCDQPNCPYTYDKKSESRCLYNSPVPNHKLEVYNTQKTGCPTGFGVATPQQAAKGRALGRVDTTRPGFSFYFPSATHGHWAGAVPAVVPGVAGYPSPVMVSLPGASNCPAGLSSCRKGETCSFTPTVEGNGNMKYTNGRGDCSVVCMGELGCPFAVEDCRSNCEFIMAADPDKNNRSAVYVKHTTPQKKYAPVVMCLGACPQGLHPHHSSRGNVKQIGKPVVESTPDRVTVWYAPDPSFKVVCLSDQYKHHKREHDCPHSYSTCANYPCELQKKHEGPSWSAVSDVPLGSAASYYLPYQLGNLWCQGSACPSVRNVKPCGAGESCRFSLMHSPDGTSLRMYLDTPSNMRIELQDPRFFCVGQCPRGITVDPKAPPSIEIHTGIQGTGYAKLPRNEGLWSGMALPGQANWPAQPCKGKGCNTCKECGQLSGAPVRCANGTWGEFCQNRCPEDCMGGVCRVQDGFCQCNDNKLWRSLGNFQPVCLGCPQNCKSGCDRDLKCVGGCKNDVFWGPACSYECQATCLNGRCDQAGGCLDGCTAGFWSPMCNFHCSLGCPTNICGRDGTCAIQGAVFPCGPGWWAPRCDQQCHPMCKSCRSPGEDQCTECHDSHAAVVMDPNKPQSCQLCVGGAVHELDDRGQQVCKCDSRGPFPRAMTLGEKKPTVQQWSEQYKTKSGNKTAVIRYKWCLHRCHPDLMAEFTRRGPTCKDPKDICEELFGVSKVPSPASLLQVRTNLDECHAKLSKSEAEVANCKESEEE
eukprot:GHVR01050140.1.p1 GENE.GHVR01050140.1~~GHVR01050140.1.p1  ORF type:complete len:991 (+),score=232.37 GHVR01050140.1:79-2973(+)